MLMSGPTGSGKTTSLYALLQYLNIDSRNIITIENPVEYAVQGYTQIEVDGHMTFAKAMRSSLRQDPDVIMVGEIRDDVSAEIALSAGTSGHMVFSTVHANSAAEIPTRLLYFGLMGHEIASVLLALVAQRLVRRIRDGVVPQWVLPNDIEREWLTKRGMFSESMRFPKIEPGDFEGRLPMVEMIEVTPAIRAIMEGHSASGASDRSDGKNWIAQIVELAVKQPQFETLAQAGVGLALAGKTTLQEVIKATGDGGYTPSRRRYEQILVHEGLLSIEDLEQSHREINEARQNGKIILLKDHLVAKNRCSKEDMAEALRRRYAPTISTPTPGIPVINPIPSGIGIQSQ